MSSLVAAAREAYAAVTSKTARRTFIYAVLMAAASAVLYGVAVVGYLAFYHEYMPHQVRTAALHLQYGAHHGHLLADSLTSSSSGDGRHPFALADLRGLGLKSDQDYDVSVVLSLPRSPANLALGNFMVEVAVLSGGGGRRGSNTKNDNNNDDAITAACRRPPPRPRDFIESDGKQVLFAAARPALLAYTDPLVARAARLLFLPYHLLAPAAAERVRLVVPMGEAVSLGGARGQGKAAVLYLEVRAADAAGSAHELQTYSAEAVFAARLRGLRWLMYHHRVTSFVALTSAFWLVEVLFMVLMFVVLGVFLGGGGEGGDDDSIMGGGRNNSLLSPITAAGKPAALIKAEDSDKDGGGIKKEEDDERASAAMARIPAASTAEEKDEEEEEEDGEEDGYEEDAEASTRGTANEELLAEPSWRQKQVAAATGMAASSLSSAEPWRRRRSFDSK